ncbi:MAG TPA: LD-carboxypeptidase [Pyrinomonadaceae bacterium]|nr:LD-carboxypeptidase [Pyrinomonadaceae bacterium]
MKKDETDINRRAFLAKTGAAAALFAASRQDIFGQRQIKTQASSTTNFIKPKALRAGDTVGLITPATEVLDPERLALAERTVNYFNLRMKLGKNVGRSFSSYRESVRARLDDLHEMFRAPEVKAVFAVRGGYGSMQMLDRIDYDLIRRNPKIFFGYSDITAMHLAINKNSRLVTFHGPVVLSRFTEYTQHHFRRAVFDAQPLGKLTNPKESNEIRPAHALRTIVTGTATGQLTGGNLSLVCATLGTPFEIDTRGKILFLEDVGEQSYRIDRMLAQLRLAGKLEQAAGIVWGECEDCGEAGANPSSASPYTLGETIDNIFGALKIPVLSGLTIGHTNDQLTLPLGVSATLDAANGTLEIKESGVV